MNIYSVTIKGSSPLMLNRMSDEALEGLVYGKASGKKKLQETRSLKEIADAHLHKDADGHPVFPLSGVTRAFAKAAGSFSKSKGRGSMRSLAAGSFRIPHEFGIIQDPETSAPHAEWIVDFRRGVNSNAGSGTAVPLIRPKFETWKIDFDVALDEELISESLAVEILNYAGRTVGLGAWRFENLGPCGGFFVSEIKKQ